LRGFPPDAVQHCTTKLTVPKVVHIVQPRCTAEGMRRKTQGRVLLDALILPDGTVGDVRLIYALDPTSGLDAQAIHAVKQWRFEPGQLDGRPVPTIVQIELKFKL
jgi:protein TonB